MNSNEGSVYVIVVAAGSGTRFGAPVPKQFCDLCGRPVLMWTLDRLKVALPSSRQVVVLSDSGVQLWRTLCERHGFESPEVVVGGETRWASVRNALDSLGTLSEHDIVMVHDGARPLVDALVVARLLDAMKHNVAALPVVPMVDSLRLLGDDGGSVPFDRSRVVGVQTPQAFRGDLIRKAYELPYSRLFTDDASVMSAAGFPEPMLVEGNPECLKITTPIDMRLAEIYLADE